MSARLALIIANTEYTDPGLAQLSAPGRDAKEFGRVLDSPEICAFDDVVVLINENSSKVGEAIDYFLSNRKPDDLLVLYFSGHGVRDEYGSLYLAVKNTNRARLRSTAIKSDFIREAMDQSRSRRQVLILDCCNSGAFTQGTKAATGVSLGTASAFEAGYGRIILTASDSTQYAWEGDKVIGETDNSLFTHFLIEGLEGEADLDGDGRITVDELYDYAYEKVKLATPKQSPSKFSSKQQGEIVLRQNMRMEEIKSVLLPAPLLDSIENPFSDVRMGAVQQLIKLLNGKNLGMARSAQEVLERIAENDDSRQVSYAARQALESIREAEKPAKNDQPEIITKEAQRIIYERAAQDAETFESGKSQPSRSTSPLVAWFTLGWGISGLFAGYLWSEFDGAGGELIAGVLGGAGGGLVTALILRAEKVIRDQTSTFRIVLAWAIGGVIGWFIGWQISGGTVAAAIGMAFFAIFGLAGTLGMDYLRDHWQGIATILLAWAIGGAIVWIISKTILIETLYMDDQGLAWAIGTAIGWGIGGYVMARQLLANKGT
ncbi:MAG: caspase family protein [Anaerolineae bacterium]|nr:caspase family protein [Anaerolineae bacterium]